MTLTVFAALQRWQVVIAGKSNCLKIQMDGWLDCSGHFIERI
jgi:hypothetical protein